jgi:repressor LexA
MTEKYLHPAQQKILNILEKNAENPLTIREMQSDIGASSTSIVTHHISQLEKKGYIKKNPYNPRDYQILQTPEKEIVYLNLYGLATCGPNGITLDGNPIERVPVSTKFIPFPSDQAFMVKARGDSMLPKISNGDYVIVKHINSAEDGEIVVGVNDGKAIIKKIKKVDKANIILISLNKEYEPFLASENFKIEGIVKGVITNKLLDF